MTRAEINYALELLGELPLGALQRAALKYAARSLRRSGEAGTESAALLLEQMAEEIS